MFFIIQIGFCGNSLAISNPDIIKGKHLIIGTSPVSRPIL